MYGFLQEAFDRLRPLLFLVKLIEILAFPEKMLLAASFKDNVQAEIASFSGADSLTLKANVLFSDLSTPLMKKTVDGFSASWRDAFGKESIKN